MSWTDVTRLSRVYCINTKIDAFLANNVLGWRTGIYWGISCSQYLCEYPYTRGLSQLHTVKVAYYESLKTKKSVHIEQTS